MPGVDKECFTHNYACDCREERFRNMENIIQDAIQSMEWMIKDIDYKNRLDESPCDSPELIKAKETLQKLKALE